MTISSAQSKDWQLSRLAFCKKLYIFFYTIIFLFLFPIFPYASELTFLYDCAEKTDMHVANYGNVAIYVSTFQLKTQRTLLHTIRTGSFFVKKISVIHIKYRAIQQCFSTIRFRKEGKI